MNVFYLFYNLFMKIYTYLILSPCILSYSNMLLYKYDYIKLCTCFPETSRLT